MRTKGAWQTFFGCRRGKLFLGQVGFDKSNTVQLKVLMRSIHSVLMSTIHFNNTFQFIYSFTFKLKFCI